MLTPTSLMDLYVEQHWPPAYHGLLNAIRPDVQAHADQWEKDLAQRANARVAAETEAARAAELLARIEELEHRLRAVSRWAVDAGILLSDELKEILEGPPNKE